MYSVQGESAPAQTTLTSGLLGLQAQRDYVLYPVTFALDLALYGGLAAPDAGSMVGAELLWAGNVAAQAEIRLVLGRRTARARFELAARGSIDVVSFRSLPNTEEDAEPPPDHPAEPGETVTREDQSTFLANDAFTYAGGYAALRF